MYSTFSAAFDGATDELPAHAEHIARATSAPVYFTKPVVFITFSSNKQKRSKGPSRPRPRRAVGRSFFIELVPPTLRCVTDARIAFTHRTDS
jgi:hypothetical protein